MTGNVTGALQLGVGGMIGYTSYAPLVSSIAQAWKDHDVQKAEAAQHSLSTLTLSLKAAGDTKMAARYSSRLFQEGLNLGPPRLPLNGINSTEFSSMRQQLIKNGFIHPEML